ncbi:hypothetical protein BURK1_03391 [Burkholderiales bacterium]|nr:hypothetical protein BURK1_03391 [Burkholderiales bacterium]
MRRNLIVVRAGDRSLHRRWTDDTRARSFDLLVSYYGSIPGRYARRAEHYHEMKGPRWPVHDWLWRHERALLGRYERVAFVCDDVDATTRTWNAMFDLCDWFGLDLAQPAIDGHAGLPITMPVAGCLLRYTNFVEVMAPVFSRRALERCGDTFGDSVSGWGLDHVWSARLPYPEFRLAIVDGVRVRHTSRVRQGTLRPVLDALGVDPVSEGLELLRRLGPSFEPAREIARLTVA